MRSWGSLLTGSGGKGKRGSEELTSTLLYYISRSFGYRNIDDRHRNPNINIRDHLVGQSTRNWLVSGQKIDNFVDFEVVGWVLPYPHFFFLQKNDKICWYLGVSIQFHSLLVVSEHQRHIWHNIGNGQDYLGSWNPIQPSSKWIRSSVLSCSSWWKSKPDPELKDLPLRTSWTDDLSKQTDWFNMNSPTP